MENIVTLGKIVSDINRVKILALLLRDKALCVCEFCDTLELSQPLVSRHLKQMKKANLISVRKEGKWMIYSLAQTNNPLIQCCLSEIHTSSVTLPELKVCQREALKSSLNSVPLSTTESKESSMP